MCGESLTNQKSSLDLRGYAAGFDIGLAVGVETLSEAA
jgi:hypothetical protein